jgi:hypothetical protein
VEAVRLLRLASAQGHARAQSALGLVLYDGAAGVACDKAAAVPPHSSNQPLFSSFKLRNRYSFGAVRLQTETQRHK